MSSESAPVLDEVRRACDVRRCSTALRRAYCDCGAAPEQEVLRVVRCEREGELPERLPLREGSRPNKSLLEALRALDPGQEEDEQQYQRERSSKDWGRPKDG